MGLPVGADLRVNEHGENRNLLPNLYRSHFFEWRQNVG
jgi:hypothetical protein